MKTQDKIDVFYAKEHRFREEIGLLRKLALQTGAKETFKWNGPVYTVNDKNVFGIMAFKNHFGIWFFNGALLRDTHGKLEAAQEKTKAMRHWKFNGPEDIDEGKVLSYLNEAIANQKQGLEVLKGGPKKIEAPALLREALDKDQELRASFEMLTPYKQREYFEYIAEAKQEKTRKTRVEKSIALINRGLGLNDRYR
jgi:uncharacterized protein YdeI (YjbR/CyaY-like superfamily)